MFNLTFSKEELDYLELLLHNHEYEESEKHLVDQLEYKFYKLRPSDYQDKLTTIGGTK